MVNRKKLPSDYAIDAMALEVDRRAKQRRAPSYSYGKLIADTTEAERAQIADTYRADYGKGRGRNCTQVLFEE